MGAKILIIGSVDGLLDPVVSALGASGLECATAWNVAAGCALVDELGPSVVLCAAEAPGTDGFLWLDRLLETHPWTHVLLVAAEARLPSAIQAFRHGVCDYVCSPFDTGEVVRKCREALLLVGSRRRPLSPGHGPSPPDPRYGLVFESAAIREVLRLVEIVAPTRCNVLITGESGTGKELVARAVHRASPWAGGPFVAINCAAIPPSLIESELFGHAKGSFTGATSNKAGYFEAARGGTLFLDEVPELPLRLQPKLLRAIQEREVHRVGATRPFPVDVRIVAASNRDVHREIAAKRFREDLYFRLCVVHIALPPLRERPEDIPPLVEHALARCNRSRKTPCTGVDREALRKLQAYAWPGNVRELESVIEQAMIVARGDRLSLSELPAEIRDGEEPSWQDEDLRAALDRFEREHLKRALRETRGNREEAARLLGINTSTLYRKLEELSLREETRLYRRTAPQPV